MADNAATYGPILNKISTDPSGTPGQTKGGVPVTTSTTRTPQLPTAGTNQAIPPFNNNPVLDPLAEQFVPPPVAGPNQ